MRLLALIVELAQELAQLAHLLRHSFIDYTIFMHEYFKKAHDRKAMGFYFFEILFSVERHFILDIL